MGVAVSKNSADTAIKNIMSIMSTATSRATTSGTQSANLTCEAQGDVVIRDIDLKQTQSVNLSAAVDLMNKTDVEQSASQVMQQLAQSTVKGLNLGSVASAENAAKQVIDQSTVISHTIASVCDAAVAQFADIRGKSIGGTCTLERVQLDQAQSLLQECTQKALTEDTAIQSAKQSLTQSAVAKTLGISLTGGVVLLVIILLVVFVAVGMKARAAARGGAAGAGGGGGAGAGVNAQKGAIWLCAIVCVVSLIAGGIMAGVGDPSKVTVYGYATQNKMDSCATRIDTKPDVQSIEEAGNTVKTLHDSKSAPSVDAFFYDASTKELTTYTKPSSVPCSGISEAKPGTPAKDDEKKWAGFVTKQSFITNIGIGLMGTSGLFFILIFVAIFAFKRKRAAGSGVVLGTSVPGGSLPELLPFVSEVSAARPSRIRAGPPPLPGLQPLV